MQREINLLKKHPQQRKGIAMLIAIAFLIITAVMMVIMVKMTAATSKKTGDLFFQEQAHLLAKSATEYALLAISGHERSAANECLSNINIQYPSAGATAIYDINVSINYIGVGAYGGTCAGLIPNISTPESNGTVLIDTYVTTSDGILGEPVRFHRRTMQKP